MEKIYSSNNNGDFKIIEWPSGKMCTVIFIDTGYVRKVYKVNAVAGKVRDPYYKSVYGVGYLGEFDKKTKHYKQAKQLWQNMLKRCYSTKDPKGYYGRGVSVSERWLCFANFLSDLPKLKNFDKWLNWKEGGTKYNLDKDFILEGNKVYCKDLCSFVTEHENKSAGALNMIKIHGAPVYRVGCSGESSLTH